MVERIADKVNLDMIHYEQATHGKKDKAVVRFAPSSGTLFFNPKMMKLLNMNVWKYVLVGYDRSSKVLILKQSTGEEYGSVAVRAYLPPKKDLRYVERAKKCRKISIKHLVEALGLTIVRSYKAERNGSMIFLESIDD